MTFIVPPVGMPTVGYLTGGVTSSRAAGNRQDHPGARRGRRAQALGWRPEPEQSAHDRRIARAMVDDLPVGTLFLIEDVDCAFKESRSTTGDTGVTLSGLLNALDGVSSREGTGALPHDQPSRTA